MKRYDLIIVGAGPSGLSAAIEAAKRGLKVVVFDENEKPGGQLFKQIHKFFGSKEHRAKVRGFVIGQQLLDEADQVGVEVELNATVIGLYQDKEIVVKEGDEIKHFKGDAIIIATGAAENMVTFPGWTLPGVIGAGAAQTMMNLHGVLPGKKVLMLGSGNVGLVVSFQLMQCGCEVVALVDAAPRVGGYGVHAAKVARTGVPFYLSHTIVEAEGDNPKRGGQVPICDEYGRTSLPGVFVAGDVSGIEEASSAMIEGRMAGIAASEYLGYIEKTEMDTELASLDKALDGLRQGMFAPKNRGKAIEKTEEGIPISTNLLKHGFVADDEIERFPGVTHKVGVHPVMECTQNIPCNPCQDACPKGCISIGSNITSLPIVVENSQCINCGMCVASCSGQAIFLVDEDCGDGTATVTIPYEFLPLPEAGTKGVALGRNGQKVCEAEVVSVKSNKAYDKTNLLTMRIPKEYAMKARFFKVG